MWAADSIIAELRARGDLWIAAPGLVGCRGALAALTSRMESRVAAFCRLQDPEEWRVPAGISFASLSRAAYFASFPQWLSAASHLPEDEDVLERIATAEEPGAVASIAQAPAAAALPPAVCYHVYDALADSTLEGARLVTAQCTCWRHEPGRFRPLARGWAFTMREVVCLGTEADVAAFRQRSIEGAFRLARELGLDPSVELATDPFFAPTARGKALLQRVKALKHELLLPVGSQKRIAAASINAHETFFGETFRIRTTDASPVYTACAAFGIERWVLAFLVAHGPHPRNWPDVESTPLEEVTR